jgi:hypothetical protein
VGGNISLLLKDWQSWFLGNGRVLSSLGVTMNRQCQLTILFSSLILFLASCANNRAQYFENTPILTPPNTPTTIPTSLASRTPTTIAADTPTSMPTHTPTAMPERPRLVETESFQGAIFPAEQVAASPYWPHNDEPWTPSEEDILTLEDQLPVFLQEYYPNLWQRLEAYTRQYWGTVTPDGNRAVYASFLCDAERMASFIDWRTDPIEVMDGGDCYFQTLYDIEEDAFVWLVVNGEA